MIPLDNTRGGRQESFRETPQAEAARKKFDALLEKLPGPDPESKEYKRYFEAREKKKAKKGKEKKQKGK